MVISMVAQCFVFVVTVKILLQYDHRLVLVVSCFITVVENPCPVLVLYEIMFNNHLL